MDVYVLAVHATGTDRITSLDHSLRTNFRAQMVFPGAWLIPWDRTCRDLFERARRVLPNRSFLLSQVENGWALSEA